jgi:LysM repeat protein
MLPLIAGVLALAGAGCFGGDSEDEGAPDLSAIPTATLPAELPEVRVLGSSALVPGGGSTYTVKSGDTLLTISEFLGVNVEDLVAANPGVDENPLSIGQVLRVPEGVEVSDPEPAEPAPTEAPAEEPTLVAPPPTEAPIIDTPTPEPPPPEPTPGSLGQTYTVQSGDIPETIAAQFGITVDALLAANPGINPNNLQVGQVLIIPSAPPAEGEPPPGG